MFSQEKLAPLALKLKTAYCECPSYDILVPALLEAGIDGLESRLVILSKALALKVAI